MILNAWTLKSIKKIFVIGNELILDNLAKLFGTKATIWVRIPLIAGINDKDKDIEMIKSYYKNKCYTEKNEFLSYHSIGTEKYSA